MHEAFTWVHMNVYMQAEQHTQAVMQKDNLLKL